MHDHQTLILTAALILIYGLVSKRLELSTVTAPMFFVGIGTLLSPMGLGWFDIAIDTTLVKSVAEITLIVILFVDASFIHFAGTRETLAGPPARLLGIGLPLSMLLGTLAAIALFPDWSIWLVLLLALILSPTDAALGQAVVKSEAVPKRIRETISIESGLNDGIALPPILVCIAVLGGEAITGESNWINFMALQLTLGPLIGGVVGYFGGRAIEYAVKKDWMDSLYQRLSAFSLALLSFAFAELVHGNGFIAAFFSGLLLGVKNPTVVKRMQEFGEAEGHMLSLFVFLILGLIGIPAAAPYWNWTVLAYALLSLSLIRMLPVYLSLVGSGLDNYTKFFLGWFGPRGIASILYLLIMIGDLGASGYEEIAAVIIITVTISTFAHGITAVPMARKYKAR